MSVSALRAVRPAAAAPAAPDYVVVDGVSKIYNEGTRQQVEAVAPSSFTVKAGEFVALLGPSGCGKSTLLMMIAGLEAVTEGRILAGGTLMTEPRSEIGIVFQDPTLLPWKTTLQNILFPIEMMHRDRSAYLGRAMELLRLVRLDDAVNKRPSQLSGGMRQRVSLCRALIGDPSILLMDEPFSALDAITRDDMNIVLLELWERYRKTVLFVTHSIREAVLLSDRVLVMGRSPSKIIAEFKVPFARPRGFAIGETSAFNELCAMLRNQIEIARQGDAEPRH
jgi:NitT/TauT family transport system ATP-binding protein